MSDFTFIQLADPQFGLFASSSGKTAAEIASFAERGIMLRKAKKIEGFAPETALFTKGIERANWLKPDFVVVCGDMINEADSDDGMAFRDLIQGVIARGGRVDALDVYKGWMEVNTVDDHRRAQHFLDGDGEGAVVPTATEATTR